MGHFYIHTVRNGYIAHYMLSWHRGWCATVALMCYRNISVLNNYDDNMYDCMKQNCHRYH